MRFSPTPPGPKGRFLLGSLLEIRREELDFLMRLVREYADLRSLCDSTLPLTAWSARH